jgi:hypothetical protein
MRHANSIETESRCASKSVRGIKGSRTASPRGHLQCDYDL